MSDTPSHPVPVSFTEHGIWAEYVYADGVPTGEAILAVTAPDGEKIRVVLSPEDAELLGDLLVQISSARAHASTDNIPNDEGAGI